MTTGLLVTTARLRSGEVATLEVRSLGDWLR